MRAEFAAFKARVAAHSMLSNKTETVVRLNADGSPVRANYVVLTPSIPDMTDERFTAPQRAEGGRLCRYDARVVAVDADGLLQLAEALHAQVVGYSLTVTDRVCGPIRLTPGVEEGRVQFDRTARLFYLDETFEFLSLPG